MRFSKFYTELWPQWLATFEVLLINIMIGSSFGLIPPLMGKLTRPDPPFEATKEETTWIASLLSISQCFGALLGAIVTSHLGSKRTLHLTGFLFLIGWTSLVLARSMSLVYVALICNGLGSGTAVVTFPLYIAEISQPNIRGTLISLITYGVMVGNLLGTVLGGVLSPWEYSTAYTAIAALFLVSFFFFPQTPHYLVRSGKIVEAERSIHWYNRKLDSGNELQELVNFLNSNPSTSLLKSFRLCNDPVNRKIIIKMVILCSFGHLNGVYTIFEYMELLFIHSNINIVLPSTLVSCMGGAVVALSWLSMFTSDRFKRTSILIVSFSIMSIATAVWGFTFHLQELGFAGLYLQCIVIATVATYMLSYTIGVYPIISTLRSEVFAPNIKYVASCICLMAKALCSFIASKNFQSMLDHLTHKYVFYFFALITFSLAIFSKVFIPETKGMSLQKIQDMLHSRKSTVKTAINP